MFSIGMLEHTHRPVRQSTTLADHGLRLAALHTFQVYLGASAAHTLGPIIDGLSIRHCSSAKDDPGIRPMSPHVFYLAHCISSRPGQCDYHPPVFLGYSTLHGPSNCTQDFILLSYLLCNTSSFHLHHGFLQSDSLRLLGWHVG